MSRNLVSNIWEESYILSTVENPIGTMSLKIHKRAHLPSLNSYIPAALKSFEAKPVYGAQLGPFSNFAPLELVQSKLLRLALLNYWLRLLFFPLGLEPPTVRDDFQSMWGKKL